MAGEKHGKKDPVAQVNRALKITCEYTWLFLVPLILTFPQLVAVECLVLKHLRVAKSEWRFKLEHLGGKRSPNSTAAAFKQKGFCACMCPFFPQLCQSD